ncbi:MAG: hypothetical protein WBB28_17665 [Crinalium sp.]
MYIAENEKNFYNVKNILLKIKIKAASIALSTIQQAENKLAEVGKTVSKVQEAYRRLNYSGEPPSKITYRTAKTRLEYAKEQMKLNDYIASLEAKSNANDSYGLAAQAVEIAKEEAVEIAKKEAEEELKRKEAEEAKQLKRREAEELKMAINFVLYPILFLILCVLFLYIYNLLK